jgi:hypothetical protein
LVVSLSKTHTETDESLKKTGGRPLEQVFADGESTEFSGRIVVALAQGNL